MPLHLRLKTFWKKQPQTRGESTGAVNPKASRKEDKQRINLSSSRACHFRAIL